MPDGETLFVRRKVGGTALLATRLKARVGVQGLVAAANGNVAGAAANEVTPAIA